MEILCLIHSRQDRIASPAGRAENIAKAAAGRVNAVWIIAKEAVGHRRHDPQNLADRPDPIDTAVTIHDPVMIPVDEMRLKRAPVLAAVSQ